MTRPRINVTDNEAWGKLVKTWATGRNYVDFQATETDPKPTVVEAQPRWPKPTSFEDFVTQCKRAQVGLVFEDANNTPVNGDEGLGFVLLQANSDTSVLRLPAAEKIAESEQAIFGQVGYPLPSFYDRVYEGGVKPNQVDTKLKKLKLHAERVGEYTINTCH